MVEPFDYIIVGGGTTGCVLAARLSEAHPFRILVIEAGEDDDTARTREPSQWLSNYYPGSPLDHGLEATQTAGGHTSVQRVLRGRALGGSSAVNAMIYHRGTRQDFDGWEALSGYGGWSYADLEPYYVKLEKCLEPVAEAGCRRGRDGVISISGAQVRDHPLSREFVNACRAHGSPHLSTPNGAQALGVSPHEFTIDAAGERSSARDYLRRALASGNPSLVVRTHAVCQQVLFEGTAATGVRLLDTHTQRIEEISCTREVIVCAGTIGSPHLLMLSGVGDREHLREHGIACVADLPGVGQNLEDHVCFFVDYAISPAWLESQPGGLSHGAGDFSVFLRVNAPETEASAPEATRPNVEIELFTFNRYTPQEIAFSRYLGALPNRYFDAALRRHGAKRLAELPTFGFLVGLTKPRGRGAVTLASADPRVKPRITTRYFDSDADMRDAVAALRYTRSLARAMACAGEELMPGAHLRTDEELGEYVRTVGVSKHHLTSTCRMADLRKNSLGVVDGELRVHGCERLRVADCSILPEIVTANTQAVAMVIGERLADLIRASP
jgi:choline dehydrogenase